MAMMMLKCFACMHRSQTCSKTRVVSTTERYGGSCGSWWGSDRYVRAYSQTTIINKHNGKTGQATIRMKRQARLKRWWTSLQIESFTVLSTASLFSSIEASSVFYHPFTNKNAEMSVKVVWRRRQIRKRYWIPYWSQIRPYMVLKGW